MRVARRPRPRAGLPRPAGRSIATVRNQAGDAPSPGSVYEASSTTRRTLGWRAPTISPNDAVLGSLYTLRDRARAADRNDGLAGAAVDRLVTNTIGTGIAPLSQADDPEFRRAVQALWLRWTDESDADGRLDWYGQQAQAERTRLVAGEVFLRLRPRRPEDGLSVPLQVQVIEPELCPHTYNVAGGSTRIRAGIEFSPIGRREAYYFYRSRPGDLQDMDPSQLVRVPAEAVLHLYDPIRPGQLRGVPHLTRALVKLHELDKFDDATLLRQQLSNLFVAFLTRQAGLGDGEAVNPMTGQTIERDNADRALMGLEPGIFQELAPGEDVKFSEPPGTAETYPDFVRQQMLGVAVAAGVPYEVLTGDMRGVNDRTVRVILTEFRRRIMMLQHQLAAVQMCRPVWRAWLDRVLLSGALEIPVAYLEDPEPWARVKWMPQGWEYINPVQDVEAQKARVRAGFASRSDIISEQGEDAEEVDVAIAADNARADRLGLALDSDPRRVSDAGLTQARPEGTVLPDVSGAGDAAQASLATEAVALARAAVEAARPRAEVLVRDRAGRIIGKREGEPVADG